MTKTPSGCPYPHCPEPHAGGAETVSGPVRLCRSCGRLSVDCRAPACRRAETRNRAFVRYCRRCGRDVTARSTFASDPEAWREVRGAGWGRAPRGFGAPTDVASLSDLENYASPDGTRVALATAQALLAVHQAGRYLALVNPFPPEGDSPWAWSAADPFAADPAAEPDVAYEPVLLPDNRFLLYSARPGVTALDLWSCPGLSAYGTSRSRAFQVPGGGLAAGPLPLGGSKVGLLAGGAGGPYRWFVWDLERPDPAVRPGPDGGVALPLTGGACQATLIEGRLVALATPEGQWLWRCGDAIAGDVGRLRRTWPVAPARGAPLESLLDAQAVNPRNLFSAAQGFLVRRVGATARSFEWFFRASPAGDRLGQVFRYSVSFDTLDPTDPTPVRVGDGAEPIGPALSATGVSEMIFRSRDEVFRETPTGEFLRTQYGLPESQVGLRLYDPLILSVGARGDGARFLQVDSLVHPGRRAAADLGADLFSDPVQWSRWLFTVEYDRVSGRLLLRRRALDFED